ncbi:MAG: hypoxanthine phosphoribosyltransferase [Actinomycetota bacterium]|nr:hypoxanthine phosphoribosyltransferase [Actinomycetota bacterium]
MDSVKKGSIIDRVLFSAEDISAVVNKLGLEITRDYEGRRPLLVSVLRGGLIFLADLARRIDLPLSVDFMAVSTYGPAVTTGVVQVLKDLDELITGRDVIVIEDIIDTGLTLNYLLQILRARQPASLEVCTLLDKSVRRIANIHIAYKGFDVPDVFVVGYGLDFEQRYRNLPFIGVLKEE